VKKTVRGWLDGDVLERVVGRLQVGRGRVEVGQLELFDPVVSCDDLRHVIVYYLLQIFKERFVFIQLFEQKDMIAQLL